MVNPMTDPTFTARANAIRAMSEDIAAAPILSRMAMATDLVAAAANLVCDMAAHIDSNTMYLDEDQPARDQG